MKISDCDAVILAGGRGTRLAHLLPPGLAKCLADVNGRPFLDILMEHLITAGFENFIFSLGYGADKVKDFINEKYIDRCEWTTEDQPLGTGGALRQVMRAWKSDLSWPFFVFNGDTLVDADFGDMVYPETPISVVRYRDRNAGCYVVQSQLLGPLEWEQRKFFNIEDLPIHSSVSFFDITHPFLDIGTPEGLLKARERFK